MTRNSDSDIAGEQYFRQGNSPYPRTGVGGIDIDSLKLSYFSESTSSQDSEDTLCINDNRYFIEPSANEMRMTESGMLSEVRISKAFRDSLSLDVLREFGLSLSSQLDKMDELKGVEHYIRIYPWESRDEDRVSFIRIELVVPRVHGPLFRDLWGKFSGLYDDMMKIYLNRPRTNESRRFAELKSQFSRGVVPIWEK